MTPEQLKQQIEQEAEEYANKEADPTYTHLEAHNRYVKRHYMQIATPYATRAITAEAENERLRKALDLIAHQEPDQGREGCTWGDTNYDSMTVAFGYNMALSNVKDIANKSLTPKPTTNEHH